MSGPPDMSRRPEGDNLETADAFAGSGAEAILEQLDAIAVAYTRGYDVGYAHGRNDRRADAELVRLHQAAAEVVVRMADLPEVKPGSPGRDAERNRLMRGPVREGRAS